MSYFAKIRIGGPVGQEALEAVPDMELRIEDIRSLPGEPWRFIFWASGGDFEAYEAALESDRTITEYVCLTELPDRRLYRTVLSERGERETLHSIAVQEDIVLVSADVTVSGIELLGRFPSREALLALRDASRERERDFELRSLYEEKPTENDGGRSDRYGITAAQREALLTALERGYFDVPRETTMEAIADSLEISTSALSTRLRRGQKALLNNTLAADSNL